MTKNNAQIIIFIKTFKKKQPRVKNLDNPISLRKPEK